jgi:GxxExxY protein
MEDKKHLVYPEESYKIIGICMQVHKHLGRGGFSEIVIKDALQYEFDLQKIKFEREVGYEVEYKGVVMPHKFYADFVMMDKIILEVKNCSTLTPNHIAQSLNYLAVSKLKLALLVNFGNPSLEYKRLVL